MQDCTYSEEELSMLRTNVITAYSLFERAITTGVASVVSQRFDSFTTNLVDYEGSLEEMGQKETPAEAHLFERAAAQYHNFLLGLVHTWKVASSVVQDRITSSSSSLIVESEKLRELSSKLRNLQGRLMSRDDWKPLKGLITQIISNNGEWIWEANQIVNGGSSTGVVIGANLIPSIPVLDCKDDPASCYTHQPLPAISESPVRVPLCHQPPSEPPSPSINVVTTQLASETNSQDKIEFLVQNSDTASDVIDFPVNSLEPPSDQFIYLVDDKRLPLDVIVFPVITSEPPSDESAEPPSDEFVSLVDSKEIPSDETAHTVNNMQSPHRRLSSVNSTASWSCVTVSLVGNMNPLPGMFRSSAISVDSTRDFSRRLVDAEYMVSTSRDLIVSSGGNTKVSHADLTLYVRVSTAVTRSRDLNAMPLPVLPSSSSGDFVYTNTNMAAHNFSPGICQ